MNDTPTPPLPATSQTYTWLCLLLLAAFLLRALPLTDNRFHRDEAWYAHSAQRIASGLDPLLLDVPLDKPPLLLYLSSLSLAVLGPHTGGEPLKAEMAVRLPSLWASLLAVVLCYRLGHDVFGSRVGVLAAALLALSPMAIAFGGTMFLDPLMTTLVLAALVSVWRGHWVAAGLLLGLAVATKQTALLYLPLLLALAVAAPRWRWQPRAVVQSLVALAIGLSLPLAAIAGWDALRGNAAGFWQAGVANNWPGRFARSSELLPRLRAWANWLQYMVGTGPLALAGLATAAGLTALQALRRPTNRRALVDLVLVGYLLGYVAVYWLVAFAVWDRYLLGLLPLVALVAARALDAVLIQLPRTGRIVTLAVLVAALAWPAARAAGSHYPVGGDHGAYDGLDAVSDYLAEAPQGAVVYDYWLSWHLAFYTFDAPVYVAWQPGPAALASDLRSFGRQGTRYLIIPAWAPGDSFLQAVADAGFVATPMLAPPGRDGTVRVVLYAITAP